MYLKKLEQYLAYNKCSKTIIIIIFIIWKQRCSSGIRKKIGCISYWPKNLKEKEVINAA